MINFKLIVPAVLICSFSYLSLLSFNPKLANQQLIFICLGLILYLTALNFDYRIFKVYHQHLYGLLLTLLILTLLFGKVIKGSSRWIDVGFFRVQPSEFGKVILLFTLAALLANVQGRLVRGKDLLRVTLVILLPSILVLLQPDLGTAAVYLLIFLTLLAVLKVPKYYFVLAFIVFGLLVPNVWPLLKDYQKERVTVFLNPLADPLGAGYNSLQSRIAVGSGQLFGKGFGSGTQSKLRFLPESHTDFIFASFSEEWGLLGVLALLTLYLLLLAELLTVAKSCEDRFGHLFVIGAFGLLFFQTFINISVNVGLLPITGITLPLMSYGGSSMVTTFVLLGIVNNISAKQL